MINGKVSETVVTRGLFLTGVSIPVLPHTWMWRSGAGWGGSQAQQIADSFGKIISDLSLEYPSLAMSH